MQGRRFVWYELMTTDTARAQGFYPAVLGWSVQDAPMPGMEYTLFALDEDAQVAGMMALTEEARAMGAQPGWYGYVGVENVDATALQARRLGGVEHVEPQDIPGIGRFAVLGDPQGAVIALFAGDEEMPTPAAGVPGRVGWHELLAADWEKAFPFYAELFGWQKDRAMDMGPMGTYQLFSAGGDAMGGMFNKPAEVPAPLWLYYFTVADIDAAAQRVRDEGGRILNGPMEVPGGSWIVQCADPQGVMFALVGPRG